MRVHPRHRGDCADSFSAPQEIARIEFDGPVATISEMEHAVARAGRTWNTQFTYVMKVCLGDHAPDFDDGRSVEDWRTLLSECNFRVRETDDWSSCMRLWRRTPRTPVTA